MARGSQDFVGRSASLHSVKARMNGQYVTLTETGKVQSGMKFILAPHKTLEHLDYPGEGGVVGDQIKVTLKQSFLSPSK